MIERTEPIEKAWSPDGPLLPVEFARHSSGNRLTLVLTPERRTSKVLWTNLVIENLQLAKRNLAIRECVRLGDPINEELIQKFLGQWCGYWTPERSEGTCANIVGEWAHLHNLPAVVWTDFPARFFKTDGRILTEEQALRFLRELPPKAQDLARNYITKTPRQIATPYRAEIERQLGWHPSGVI